MPQLLLELLSEEIPARMQAQAARDLERMARERLGSAELQFEALQTFAGPRRLTLVVDGLPLAQADRVEERKGPRTNAPDKALEGFLRSTGLAREQLEDRDGVYFATIDRPGRPTAEIVAELVEAVVRGFPWPKSMRWGAGALRWVRPLQRILCLFDAEVVPLAIDGIVSGDLTLGHRFMGEARAPFAVAGFQEYQLGLEKRFVILDAGERKRRILEGAREVCAARGLELVEDEGLLDEVAGLVEWPVPILGDMDPAYLDLPPEVIRTSMRVHQRYFAVRDPAKNIGKTGGLAPHFVVVANIEPTDGGAVVAAGNARVLSARLSDARFFWTEDQRPSADGTSNFDRWLEKLHGVTFHAKLGTMAERVTRIEALAREIAPLVGAEPELAAQAARLCKVDLASAMVGEFPELQGVMGGYYARMGLRRGASFETQPAAAPQDDEGGGAANLRHAEEAPELVEGAVSKHALTSGEIDEIADAIRDHYKPQGPSDTVPTAPVTVAVALADKLDTLVGFFAINERPTGSRDPYALRRALLGSVRQIVRGGFSLSIGQLFVQAHRVWRDVSPAVASGFYDTFAPEPDEHLVPDPVLISFLADRLKVLLRDEGKRHDLVDAVFALGDDDLVRIVAQVEALDRFLQTEDGASLLAGYKRASNILKAEAKKQPDEDYGADAEPHGMTAPEEDALAAALRTVAGEVDRALDVEDFAGAMLHLSHLRTPVDNFFDKVLVNDADPAVRLNRLRLLSQVRGTADRIADFSLISG